SEDSWVSFPDPSFGDNQERRSMHSGNAGQHNLNRKLAALAVFALVGAVQWVRADPVGGDPVEALRQILKEPARALATRDRALKDCLPQLREIDDQRRALALHEWRDATVDGPVAAVDRTSRRILIAHFEQAVRALLHDGNATTCLAVIDMLARSGVTL